MRDSAMTVRIGSRRKNDPKRESELEDSGSTFGTLELDFIFIPKLRLLEDGLYLIRKKQKKLWEDIRSIDRCDAGMWLLLRPGWLGSYVYFRSGGSLWISSRIVRKDQPLTPRRSVWTVWRTKDYDFLMDEILSHIKSTDVSVYAAGPKHVRIAETMRLVLFLALLVLMCFVLVGLLTH
jgi:hypothetical protein